MLSAATIANSMKEGKIMELFPDIETPVILLKKTKRKKLVLQKKNFPHKEIRRLKGNAENRLTLTDRITNKRYKKPFTDVDNSPSKNQLRSVFQTVLSLFNNQTGLMLQTMLSFDQFKFTNSFEELYRTELEVFN